MIRGEVTLSFLTFKVQEQDRSPEGGSDSVKKKSDKAA